jgi:hypothetical protein
MPFKSDLDANQRRQVEEVVGLEVERLERSKWGIVERLSARKPEPG